MVAVQAETDAPFVEAVVNYQVARPPGSPPVLLDQDDFAKTTVETAPHDVRIHDARKTTRDISLATTGFELIWQVTAVTDFHDRDQLTDIYVPEVVDLMKRVTGAHEVLVFGEVLRSDSDEIRDRTRAVPAEEKRDRTRQGVSASAHIDYDRASVEAYVADIAGPARAAELLKYRYELINLWRGVTPVERAPLAVCDASTVRPEDLVPWEIRHPVGPKFVHARTGWQIAYNPDHRWYYFPRMTPDEVLLFKLCDSDPARVQLAAHTAFADPAAEPDAPPRVSFEIRAICFHDRR